MLKIRYMRPFPSAQIAEALKNCKSFAVLEKDISFGAEGTVFTNVKSALFDAQITKPALNFIGGLGGDDITTQNIEEIFERVQQKAEGEDIPTLNWLNAKEVE